MFSDEKNNHRILEFQSRLLHELSLAPGPSMNKISQFKNIAAAAREVMDVYFLYTYQQISSDRQKLEFFWANTPSALSREIALQTVRDSLCPALSLNGAGEDCQAVHAIAVPDSALPDFSHSSLDLRSKSFSFDDLGFTGRVGIGLAKDQAAPCDAIAVDNLLVALISLVGTAKTFARYNREVERFATRDPLTNLFNQMAFWDLLQNETERSRRQQYKFSLLKIDIDNFKAINDTYGHDAGDMLLQEFASVLKTAVRGGDMTARYAGDEFTAILPVCDEDQANIVAQRIIENLRSFSVKLPNGSVIQQTVSIGIAVFPDHAKEAKDLYLMADSMLLQAKTQGKDRFNVPRNQDDVEIAMSIRDKNLLILEALSQRKFVPYFQPIVNVKSGVIEAYEVLTRIVLPDRVIPAAEFIETAESMGAIGKIDYQLIELAFSKVKESKYQGKLFLNLSPKALVLNEFIPTVRNMLRVYGLDPSKLVFEITERDTVKALDVIEKYIHELKREGFRFAIDDFGAGYSSFQYIKTFSIDYLKVDGEFIRNLSETSVVENAIVSSIAGLADKLGIKTIAEFVETKEVLGHVGSAGIHYAQGYFIKKPSPDLL
jgi:diguanylate cyclase (GGDEF)-like protein